MPAIPRSAAPALLLAAAILAGTGCQSLLLRSPHAEVQRVELGDDAGPGQRVQTTVRVTNPNDVPLPVWGVDYRVDHPDGDARFTMLDHPPVTLPARGHVSFVLPAGLPAAPDHPGRPAVRGRVIYEPPGQIRARLTDLGIPRPSARFHARAEALD